MNCVTTAGDFISIGAASGFAAAFGAPLGGVLFALEETCRSTLTAHHTPHATRHTYMKTLHHLTDLTHLPTHFPALPWPISHVSSFWSPELTWRMLTATLVSTFTLMLFSSRFSLRTDLGEFGLLSLSGHSASTSLWEIPLFVLIGVLGG